MSKRAAEADIYPAMDGAMVKEGRRPVPFARKFAASLVV
jgi:hypothetical protein